MEDLFWLVVNGCHFWHFPIYKGLLIIPIDAYFSGRGFSPGPPDMEDNHWWYLRVTQIFPGTWGTRRDDVWKHQFYIYNLIPQHKCWYLNDVWYLNFPALISLISWFYLISECLPQGYDALGGSRRKHGAGASTCEFHPLETGRALRNWCRLSLDPLYVIAHPLEPQTWSWSCWVLVLLLSKFRCKWSPFRFNWSLYLLNCCWEGVCACVRRPVVTGWEWFGWDNRVGYVCPLALWVQWPIVRLFFRNLLSKGRLPKARLAMRWAMVKMERQRMRGDCFWDHWLPRHLHPNMKWFHW